MKKFYLTTSIAYINAAPHVGYALELVQADVIARYRRILGDNVFFLTGTDENGSKAFETAKELKISPKELADKNSILFQKLTKSLKITNDFFIRTTDKKVHWKGAELLWKKLTQAGDIYLGEYKGFYCVGCEAFITKKELVDGKCPIHQKKPEILAEKNYFFRLSKYQNQIKKLIETSKLKIVPKERANEILNIISEKLSDVSFSRPASKLPWGVPVPNDPTHIVYVWGDALTNYLTGAGYGRNNSQFTKFWPANIHFVGKDIFRFHAIYWPAMLLSAGLPLPKTIFVHGFITSGGAKMSKSLGNIIDPFEIISKAGADSLRFYLLSQIPPTDDGDFTWGSFKNVYNGQLANGLGNLVARIAALAESSGFSFNRPKVETAAGQLFRPARQSLQLQAVADGKNKIGNLLEEFKFNHALDLIWQKITETDKFINQQKPWELLKSKSQKLKTKSLLCDLVGRIREIASLLSPFMPETSVAIQKQFKGPAIKSEKSLFPKIA